MTTFIGTNWYRPRHAQKSIIVTGRHGLLYQGDAKLQKMRSQISIDLGAPAFIGVDNDLGVGRTGPYRLQARHIIRGTKFYFQQRAVGVFGSLYTHFFGRIKRQRVSSQFRTRHRKSRQLPDPPTGLFCLEIPQRAVNRIACGSGRH